MLSQLNFFFEAKMISNYKDKHMDISQDFTDFESKYETLLVYRFQINITMIQSFQAFHPSCTST